MYSRVKFTSHGHFLICSDCHIVSVSSRYSVQKAHLSRMNEGSVAVRISECWRILAEMIMCRCLLTGRVAMLPGRAIRLRIQFISNVNCSRHPLPDNFFIGFISLLLSLDFGAVYGISGNLTISILQKRNISFSILIV